MKFKELSVYLQRLEKTPSRNSMTEILSELFKKVPIQEMDKVMYLLQGRVVPLYVDLEFGMADKMIIKSIAQAFDTTDNKVKKLYKKVGDLGEVAQDLDSRNGTGEITVSEVYSTLKKTAELGGKGSVDKKITGISDLLKDLDPLSARFVARIPINKLRLGFSDMTILDSLSWMLAGDKSARGKIEKAYNIRPDLGYIAKKIKESGLRGIEHIRPAVFTPILMARAERLSSGEEIVKKIGKSAIEPKFDGFRLQAHLDGKEVKLFTRNLEEVTFMYPDIVEGIKTQIKAKDAILEGEAIAYSSKRKKFLPFQLTSQRKRKYDIEAMVKKIPLRLMCFELLYLNGKNLIAEPYTKRRQELSKIIGKGNTIYLSEEKIIDDPQQIDNFFDYAIAEGLEGILAKRLTGEYQAGARGWNWIKLKGSYTTSALTDTIDAVVMGYNKGQGKRSAFGLGAFLIGIFDTKKDAFVTIAKVGTGLTDDEWKELFKRSGKITVRDKPKSYVVDKTLEPDVWVEPKIVVEIRADELTRSKVHTAGRTMKKSKSGKALTVDMPGYALRFPRLEKFRDDKKPTDATTLREVEEMFESQKK